jgi:phosphohistidine phosphatase
MDLYIIRHAWAEQRDASRWPDDDSRPLTPDGEERFALVAKKLVRCGMAPALVATSPLVRCVQTTEILAAAMPSRPKIVALDELRPGSDLEGLLQWTGRHGDKRDEIAWVGHAPDVDRLTAAVIGGGDSLIHFSKGAAAAVHFDGLPARGRGELRWLATAKVLGV